jgi:hypothetical protein
MSPVEIALGAACALLLVLVGGAALTLRQLSARTATLQRAVDRLCDQVEELVRREAAREVAEETDVESRAREADWVITRFDDEDEQRLVPAQQVVSTALGEPLIKVAALSHGVRQALREERRAHLAFQVRREYRRRRRQTRARTRAARSDAARTRAARTAQERTTQERTTP